MSYILSKTDMVAPLFYICVFESRRLRRARRNTDPLNFHMCLRMRITWSWAMCVPKNGEISIWIKTIIRLFLDDTGVSQQIPQIPGPSLHMFARHILEIFQDLTVAEISGNTHTQTVLITLNTINWIMNRN